MASTDFTFPATADSSPDSPPLWCHSTTAPRLEGGEEEGFNLPSFQAFRFSKGSKERDDEEGEEKMDMLWEDLNEDRFAKNGLNSDTSPPRREVRVSCIRGLRLSKANGHIISGKKTSILLFIKALKKVFLMHNSQRGINKKPS
ncbi:hypothetical protein SASPL_104281 [Salvia splendens]|uniref:Uncharacterized protein n=1 Tax=Salvia splendens TaxID=180675 RepID=A0A8X8YHN9_SALSN|nr:uncharacterized protein LOC121772582 [Salvia splendens]KAG6432696.1 hypothetical protein SASPL_104281 [Salvia splendens]